MDTTTALVIFLNAAIFALYLMAVSAENRAKRAEAALARVEAVIAEHPRYSARTVGAVAAKPLTGEVAE